jgi:CO/xanthine dehydrogenase Mo-binding subunit
MNARPRSAIRLSRRAFVQTLGALVVTFRWTPFAAAQPAAGPPRSVDGFLALGRDGTVALSCGKVELGTGLSTAMVQLVAEELDVAPERVRIVMGDTARGFDQGPTVGSKSLQLAGPEIRRAAAEARQVLLELATSRLGVEASQLAVDNGVVKAQGRAVGYAELLEGRRFERSVGTGTRLKAPAEFKVIGKPVQRIELAAKVTGTHEYIHDVRVPDMLHARVLRPPAQGARLIRADESSLKGIAGNPRVIVRGDFVGVIAEREENAIAALRALKLEWRPGAAPLPAMDALETTLRATPFDERQVVASGDVDGALASARRSLRASYAIPFQSHASMGPSCAVADVRDGRATIWSATQSSWALRDCLADLLKLSPQQVRVIWVEGSGCYGHNGADDVSGDAAVLSQAVGKPVRVQWMRNDEFGFDPKGPAMIVDLRGALDAEGRLFAWDFASLTPTHSTRPQNGAGGNLIAGALQGLAPRYGLTGGDRNARHDYRVANQRVTVRWLKQSVLRPSALRGLGAPGNVFAIESFIDELAAAASADPLEFRLAHTSDERARAVLSRAGEISGWTRRPSPSKDAAKDIARGRGIAFARYENVYAYAAIVAEVEVDRTSGVVRVPRVSVAHDCGLIVNPDGLRNQLEGNVVQTLSRALKEEVRFDRDGVVSLDWSSYPILRFPEVPAEIRIALIDRPDQPMLGAGEPAAVPVFGAVGNAIFDATGARLRRLPFTSERVSAALRGAEA